MNTAEILSLVSLICFILAGICLALALLFWFLFKIPTVIGDLSGRTARKSIAQRRQANERSGNKSYRPSATNAARGKLTETMEQSKQPKKQPKAPIPAPVQPETGRPETGLLNDNRAQTVESEETAPLDNGATALLVDPDATTPLSQTAAPNTSYRTGGKKLTMINEVMLIHTDEVITGL